MPVTYIDTGGVDVERKFDIKIILMSVGSVGTTRTRYSNIVILELNSAAR